MWDKLLDHFLNGLIVNDRLTIEYPDGTIRDYGPDTGQTARIKIHDPTVIKALCINPDLGFGEGYMSGKITLQDTTLEQAINMVVRNREVGTLPAWLRLRNKAQFHMRRFVQINAPAKARANVAHHYDISDDLYGLFLDADMQYSCAYFTDPKMSLEDAQSAKKSHIAHKLQLEPGMHVLDIGCGWGGMAITLARDFGARVTGITLSENQLATAQRRAEQAGLADQITFDLQDYRHTRGQFDGVVSVGMLEHVGLPNYATYFGKVAEVLAPNGTALIHTIGRTGPPTVQSRWITKYIFPGGDTPSLSDLAKPIEKSGLWQADIEVWRLHYAMTIRHWRNRFEANLDTIKGMYDEEFVRMFRYYFTVCIAAFEHQMQAVYHFQLSHKRDAVPLTRDYLYGS